MTEIYQQILLAVLLGIVSLLGFALRQLILVGIAYLRARIGQAEYERVLEYARVTVKALEQTPVYKDFSGDKKKELARVAVMQFAKEHNLPIDDTLFDKFIEAAVKEMNDQVSGIDWVAGEIVSGPEYPMIGSDN